MTVLEDNGKGNFENGSAKIAIHIPIKTFNALRKEFDIFEEDVEGFVTSLIERIIMEHAGEANSKVLTGKEEKELEDDLKGLGYL
jgi:hypothetical protein